MRAFGSASRLESCAVSIEKRTCTGRTVLVWRLLVQQEPILCNSSTLVVLSLFLCVCIEGINYKYLLENLSALTPTFLSSSG